MSESKAEYYAKHLEQQAGKQCSERATWLIGAPGGKITACAKHCEVLRGKALWHSEMLGLDSTFRCEYGNPPEPVETVQPTSLPTLLARMVTEFQVGLGDQSTETHEALANHFTIALLACAQPLLTEYLNKLADPPYVVKKSTPTDYIKAEQAMEMARAGYPDLARKHLGLDEEDKQLAYREFCARLALASPDAPTPSFEEWEAARKRMGLA